MKSLSLTRTVSVLAVTWFCLQNDFTWSDILKGTEERNGDDVIIGSSEIMIIYDEAAMKLFHFPKMRFVDATAHSDKIYYSCN